MRTLLPTVALFISAFSAALTFGQVGRNPETYPKVDAKDATVHIKYHEFVLLKCDGNVIALHVMPDPRFGWAGINYRWYHLTDGSDKFFLPSPAEADATPNRQVKTGAGDTDEVDAGFGEIKVGTFIVRWSKADKNSGWLYLSDVRDKVLVYPKQFRRLEDVSGKLDAEKWQPLKVIEDPKGP